MLLLNQTYDNGDRHSQPQLLTTVRKVKLISDRLILTLPVFVICFSYYHLFLSTVWLNFIET
ncbi:hypothetical protein [Picosynechococcus sp. PCC 8807]|uniref:hypothetical protein n=1 Tax=Picosynechococcus sp. PCC 8807 TaxID=195248 RepID=UPI0012EE049C|nr:hypothetical protein [Picosynechococcus sp. PCC 8807]